MNRLETGPATRRLEFIVDAIRAPAAAVAYAGA